MVIDNLSKWILSGELRRFYKRGTWKGKREKILKRDNWECQKCKNNGKYSRATTVHHIKHLTDRPDLALTGSNLVSLCSACHNEEHPEKLKRPQAGKKEHITVERW